jgi:Outer membrane lipoprotein-sorting protein
MKATALALAACMLLPMAAQGRETRGALADARERVQSADYRMSGHLVRVDGSGTRTSYSVNIKAHWFPGALNVFFEVASPAAARVHVLLQMRPGGKSTIQIARPGEAKASELAFAKWNDGPLGDAFSNEDFLEATYFWANQTPLGEAKFGARNCDQIKSMPGTVDETHYAEVKSWLDNQSGFPVYVEKTMKGSGAVKEFTYYGLRQTRGVWSASQVEAKVRGRAGSTRLIIDRGTPKAHLELKDFSPGQLTHF